MTMPTLTVIPAGAGSGKTYTIQQQLGDWVRDGLIAPERIVAVFCSVDERIDSISRADLLEHIERRFIGTTMRRSP